MRCAFARIEGLARLVNGRGARVSLLLVVCSSAYGMCLYCGLDGIRCDGHPPPGAYQHIAPATPNHECRSIRPCPPHTPPPRSPQYPRVALCRT